MKSSKMTLGKLLQYIVMIFIGLIMVFPFFWILSSSLKDILEVRQFPPVLFPTDPKWENYVEVLTDTKLWLYLRNTVLLILGNTVGTIISSSLVAYPLARLEFPGRDLIFGIIVATMMVPGITLIIPQYTMFNSFGWLDTLLPMIIPAFFAYPYNVFLFRQFFRSIPKSLDESGYIDGCSKIAVYFRILLPLSKPIIATIGTLSAVHWWNELSAPLIYINGDTWKPLIIGLMTRYRFYGGNVNIVSWPSLMAVSMLMIIPPALLYAFGSQQLTEGIKTSGMKG